MKVEIDSHRTLTAKDNIGSLLKHLASSQSTGCLEVTGGNTKWYVFLHLGGLLSIECSVRSVGQLIYRLRQLGGDEAANAVNVIASSNMYVLGKNLIQQELDRLVGQQALDRTIAIKFSTEVTKEGLESLLWLQAGSYHWQEKESSKRLAIDYPKSRLDLAKLIDYYQQRLTAWQNHITIVQSPHQRPYLTQEKFLDKTVVSGSLSSKVLRQVTQLMRGASLRELSLLLKQDELKVIHLLIPYIREHVICLRAPSALFQHLPQIPEPNLPTPSRAEVSSVERDAVRSLRAARRSDREASLLSNPIKTYKIACIDDSPAVLDELERFLHRNGSYLLTKIKNPIQASSLIFRLKPDLILMDVTMPNINGYQLCHLFRNCDTFKQTPIIMVTGNKGFIDKARAKIVGATDYLTKPFTEVKLLELVRKHLV